MKEESLWVLVEKRNDAIHPVTLELLTKARDLNKSLQGTLVAVMIGKATNRDTSFLGLYGVEEVLEIQSQEGTIQCPEVMAEILCMAASEEHPSIILAGATAFGRTLMPLIAVQLKTGLTADCTELKIDSDRKILLQTRPAFGGNILAVIECSSSSPQMATVRPHVFKMMKASRPARVVRRSMKFNPVVKRVTEVLERVIEDVQVDITQADIIVSGGRGLGKAEGFALLNQLSNTLGGMMGASRGVVDLGWISPAHQVGQTGHTVNPRLYIACGISGAVQHIAGMKGSEVIVAINEDPEAPIFEIADYGLIGDLYDIVPAILKEIAVSEED